MAATPAFNKGRAFFYPENREKEDRKVMIHPFQAGLNQPAGRAHSGLIVQFDGFGLNAGDEKKHGPILTFPPTLSTGNRFYRGRNYVMYDFTE
jgi:hypothetical protein